MFSALVWSDLPVARPRAPTQETWLAESERAWSGIGYDMIEENVEPSVA